MKPPRSIFACTDCGAQSQKWLGRCPECGAWNSFVEERSVRPEPKDARPALGGGLARPYAEVDAVVSERLSTGIGEFDRVLSSIGPRFDRVLYLWYTESIVEVGRSYRNELIAALEREERDEAVEIMRRAWARFRGIVAAREDEAGP